MDAVEIFKKVRKIEIKTRGLVNQVFAGQYHSMFKGRGMAFSEVREYQYGDDIRSIDWNVTARFNHPYVKVFDEERELTVMLLVDVSGSNQFGTRVRFKQEAMTEIAAVLAFSAIKNNDKVGVIFFSDKIEKFIPPKKGTSHILRIIRELVDFKAISRNTDISGALRYLTNVIKKRSTVFLLSDFVDEGYENALKIAGNKHDLIALRVFDQREAEMPDVGLVQLSDSETGAHQWIDTSDAALRYAYKVNHERRNKDISNILKRSGVDFAEVRCDMDYVPPLMKLFRKRGTRA